MDRSLFAAFLAATLVLSGVVNAKNFEMFAPGSEDDDVFVNQFRAAPAVRAGDYVYISGVVGFRPQETEPTEDAYAAAIRDAFIRVGEALAPAGAGWDDVIEMTSFHVDMRDHQETFKKVREEFVTEKPYSAWTAIGVEKLWADMLFVEIRVVAYVGDGNE